MAIQAQYYSFTTMHYTTIMKIRFMNLLKRKSKRQKQLEKENQKQFISATTFRCTRKKARRHQSGQFHRSLESLQFNQLSASPNPFDLGATQYHPKFDRNSIRSSVLALALAAVFVVGCATVMYLPSRNHNSGLYGREGMGRSLER